MKKLKRKTHTSENQTIINENIKKKIKKKTWMKKINKKEKENGFYFDLNYYISNSSFCSLLEIFFVINYFH